VPGLFEGKAPGAAVRVWCAACSTGQEAYSLAILFTEVAQEVGARVDFKIFATDVDAEALEIASQGRYADALVDDLGEARLHRFFTRTEDGWVVDRELRRRIVFAPHNVGRDPPFTRLDLVSCRNVLIYLAPALQRRVLASFAFGLRADGYLFLGTSESLGDIAERFRVVDGHWKIFRRLPGARGALPELAAAPLVHARVCQYENSSNGDFLIDRLPGSERVWLVGGGSGHGFKHGPAVGERVARHVLDAGLAIEPRFSLATKGKVARRTVF
jgi:two-component system CheB/CheR fusion protein